MTITIIGDVHGNLYEYHKIASKSEYSIQIGDFGFAKQWNTLNYLGLDSANHKIIPGNHDDYNMCELSPFCMGSYGLRKLNDVEFFFVRGGYSIDCGDRRAALANNGPQEWWHQEQLTYAEMRACEESWKRNCPKVVLSHTPPNRIIKEISNKRIMERFGYSDGFQCMTSQFLDFLFDIHQPELWVFGHMHTSCQIQEGPCSFIGLNILESLEI